jgi:hypothetical protein
MKSPFSCELEMFIANVDEKFRLGFSVMVLNLEYLLDQEIDKKIKNSSKKKKDILTYERRNTYEESNGIEEDCVYFDDEIGIIIIIIIIMNYYQSII